MYRLGIYTLGCKVNQYESEALAEAAAAAGFSVISPEQVCDVYIINTCTVTGESDRKSRQFIRRAMATNPDAGIIVTGCLSQVSPASASLDGVDCIIGSRSKLETVNAALMLAGGRKSSSPDIRVPPLASRPFEKMKISHFPRTRAYIKIEDGCESSCTYCIIPAARGPICSKPAADVLSEIESLAAGGCREIVLTGIETAAYGKDLGNYRLSDLLCDADRLVGNSVRIRLGSLDPSLIRADFVEKISRLACLAPHFHLSMQSGSDRILALMKRKYNTSAARAGMALLRSAVPEVQFTTDFIVGFPGETAADFDETVSFAVESGFLAAHIFPYSKRNGTPAAAMPLQIAPPVKRDRAARLTGACRAVTAGILSACVGKTYPVLFESYEKGFAVGHTPSFIEVAVPSPAGMHSEIHNVEIIGTDGVRCVGRLKEQNKTERQDLP